MDEIATTTTQTIHLDQYETDDEYVFSPFTGLGLFLTGEVDTDAVRATFAIKTLHEMLDETRLGRQPA